MPIIERDWHGLYSDSWKGEIIDEAFAHPAKFARGLIRRIYAHALEQGWIKPGDAILDPFAGVGLGGCDAIPLGLHWIGMELEEKFVTLGNLNIDLWYERMLKAEQWGLTGWGTAEIIQGDSRQLCQVLREAGAVVSSPPYSESLASDNPDKRGGLYRDPKRRTDKTLTAEYGESEGQIGKMPEGDFDAAIGSPPYAGSINQQGVANDAERRIERKEQAGIDTSHKPNVGGPHSVLNKPQVYGSSPGQLGAMPPGEIDAALGSPPWEDNGANLGDVADTAGMRQEISERSHKRDTAYGFSRGQLGTESGATFWSAAALIMAQTYSVLRPGAVAIWVLKAFVRDKQIVDFPSQWKQLGEACGFETIEIIRAWLIEDRGTQYDLFGGSETKTIARKSFFRRLYEDKYPENSIDFEIVLVQRKPR